MQSECRRQEEASARLRELSSATSEHPLVAGSFAEQGEDAVTGLPSDSMARHALQSLYDSHQEAHLAIFRMDNLKVVNTRYGRDAGNRLLMEGSQVLAQAMHPKDRLFRWGGPSFLAVLDDRPSLDAVKGEMDRVVNRARDHNVLFEGRSVFFKVAISVMCLRALQFPDLNALAAKIEAFVQPGTH